MSKVDGKFHLKCKKCNHIINDFAEWFSFKQKCPECENKWVDVEYSRNVQDVVEKIKQNEKKPESFWQYFDFLPLMEKSNIISQGEGVIPVDRWDFFEEFAKQKYNINCKVFAYRNDLNGGTGTFKDVAAAMAASVLKENGVKQYAVASTGNIATAFSHYLALAGISLSVFIPSDALKAHESEISSYGQRVFRVNGDYAKAKKIAAEYSEKYDILLSGGNTDPMRVEAKKTMVFEWLRILGELPTVYIQALSGGTGPIAIDKACEDIKDLGLFSELPRFIMVQPDKCDPMTAGWEKAKANNFPDGWENDYPILENPVTAIPTLATGNPATYPIISQLVRKSNGEIISFSEDDAIDVARLIAFETNNQIGPASTIAVGGFFNSLKKGLIKDNDLVMINVGEGVKRAPEFMEQMIYTTKTIDSINDCEPSDRMKHRNKLWEKFV
ncbi:MAG: pyridoxal-phosphate dependent enzyme [Bacteroidetes bacterium]|jgi:threonine synthase|nr:pyridoxal-phosphate dependent enzyme [Bacteroidota bacterium]MBT6685677.1 pyridoxal-phosphate dependent enzyme [Bacteroidota bacterium]MBT7141901.1 pyridoxal-phosphate dependent enzyme [Bacteroidota bacterium]MBT7491022.1 pyridoxal-phosphate dependent enzyme [Bacteroidota bacterium]